MQKDDTFNVLTSQYYDREMNDYELVGFEARMAISKDAREYTDKKCFEFFKISNSIKLVKQRSKYQAQKMFNRIIEKSIENKSFINLNISIFQSFYKHFRNLFLSFFRHYS